MSRDGRTIVLNTAGLRQVGISVMGVRLNRPDNDILIELEWEIDADKPHLVDVNFALSVENNIPEGERAGMVMDLEDKVIYRMLRPL